MIAASLIFIHLLLLMLCLAIIGEPLRVLLSRYSSLFRELDTLQAWTLNICLAGLILYVIALIPLPLFSLGMAWGLLIACTVLSLVLHRGKLKRFFRHGPRSEASSFQARLSGVGNYVLLHKASILKGTIVFAMFVMVLWIQVFALRTFIVGGSHDHSLHSLLVELILENGHIPETMQPYLPEGIIYPAAFHTIPAYASYILGYPAAKAVFYMSPLFIAMSVLGGYYLGRRLSPRGHLDISFAFIFAFVATWPMQFIWGSAGFVGGFCLFLICLSFLPALWGSEENSRTKDFVIAGVLFGYLGAEHLAFYLVLFTAVILWLMVKVFHRSAHLRARLSQFFITFGFSLLPPAIFLYRFVKFYPYPSHNIGVPTDCVFPAVGAPSMGWFVEWVSTNAAPTSLLRQATLILFAMSIIVILLGLVLKNRPPLIKESSTRLALVTFAACLLVMFYTTFARLGLPLIPWYAPVILLFVPVYLLMAMLNVHLYRICRTALKPTLGFHIFLVVFVVIYTPFVHYRISENAECLAGTYRWTYVTEEDDYELMLWIKENVEQDAVILVNEYESGTYIPSVSHRKAIFPFVGSRYSRSYQELQGLIQQGSLDARAYQLMENFGITHIYVGSTSIYWWEKPTKWDAEIFLSNPNFRLVKNMGQAYLFEVLYVDPYVIFEDDFEYESLAEAGWQFAMPQEFQETGSGSATITSERAYHGERSMGDKGERG